MQFPKVKVVWVVNESEGYKIELDSEDWTEEIHNEIASHHFNYSDEACDFARDLFPNAGIIVWP